MRRMRPSFRVIAAGEQSGLAIWQLRLEHVLLEPTARHEVPARHAIAALRCLAHHPFEQLHVVGIGWSTSSSYASRWHRPCERRTAAVSVPFSVHEAVGDASCPRAGP
jgi:hypothetical protein